jgi:hypothetical protein
LSHREKVAWLSLVAMAVTFGPYFILAAVAPSGGGLPGLRSLALFAAAAVAQAVILGVGHWYLRHRSPLDARTPPDERDRAIDRRSVAMAYYVLIAGMVVVGVVMPFNTGGWEIVNAALLALITAEVVHYAWAAASYRMQS